MNYVTELDHNGLTPEDVDVSRFEACLLLSDDHWPHVKKSDGAYSVASDNESIIHLCPAPHGRAFAWTEVGPTTPHKRMADVMGLGRSLAESLYSTLGCQFFFDQSDRPCVGYKSALPDLGKWNDPELMRKALAFEEDNDDLFDEAINAQIEATDAVGHLVETVDLFCGQMNPAIGPLSAGATPAVMAVAKARDIVIQQASCKGTKSFVEASDVVWSLPDNDPASSYSNCQEIALIKTRYSSYVGTDFIDGALCRLDVRRFEGGTVAASMCLPGSKSHNPSPIIIVARAHLLGEHYLEEPNSIWNTVSVHIGDGQVVLRKTWPFGLPTVADIDQFARDAKGFIRKYGEKMLDAGDPARLSRLFSTDADGVDTLQKEGDSMCVNMVGLHQPIISVPMVPSNVYVEDVPS